MPFLFIIIIVVGIIWFFASLDSDSSSNSTQDKSYTCGECENPLEGNEVYCPKCKKKINWG
jgi:predicted amidophosphoribosyltransferase